MIAIRAGLLLGWLLLLGTAAAKPASILEFANGDAIEGTLEPGEGDVIRWRSKWFESPLEIDPMFLKRVTFERVPVLGEVSSFRALLRNGDVVHGNLVRIGPGFVELESARHGTTRLQTAAMRSLNRLDNPSLRYSGPVSVEGWIQSGPGHEESYWSGVPGGGISTRRWGAALFHRFELPQRVAIEVKLVSSRRPEFAFALQAFRGDGLRLETWDDEVVLVESLRQYHPLYRLGPDDREVHLHLFWDQATQNLSIFTATGRLLGRHRINPGVDFADNSGIALRNKGLDLELARLRVAEWRGDQPELQSIEGERIQRIDGSALREKAIGFDTLNRSLLLEGGKVVPLADLETMVFDERAMEEDTRQTVQLTYSDGTRISGNLVKSASDGVVVKTRYSESPLACGFADLTSLEFAHRSGPEVMDAPDELRVNGDLMHGTLAGVQPGGRISWRPLGGNGPVALRPGLEADVVRRKGPGLTHLAGDRLFLVSREILTCRLESIREGIAYFSSPITSLTQLPVDQIRAVEFGQPSLRLSGFDDPSWLPLEAAGGGNELGPSKMVLRGGGYGHAGVLRADEVQFTLEWEGEGQGAVTVGLFTGPGPSFNAPIQVSFSRWGNRIWVAASQPGGNRMIDGDDIMVHGGRLSAKIVFREDQMVVSVDGQELVDCVFPAAQRTGAGLRFEFGGPWFNAETVLAAATISDFQLRSSNGLISSFQVDADLKQKTLTIPRRLKTDPPTHCLVAANGDVLRGKLLEVNPGGIRFDLQGEVLPFPRDRVLGLVHLTTADHGEAATEGALPDGESYLFLAEGSAVRLQTKIVNAEFLEGGSPLLGACKIPLASIRQLRVGNAVALPDEVLHANWVPVPAPEPIIPGAPGAAKPGGLASKGEAPLFTLPLLAGGTFQSTGAQGRILVIEFWASWNGPSRMALNEISEILKTFEPGAVQFLAVNLGEPANVIKPYYERSGWSFPVGVDATETTKPLFGVESVPHTVVVDATGQIVWSQGGFRAGAGQELAQVISTLLGR
jgi:thiol-disulfide isomerase/thioredoxin